MAVAYDTQTTVFNYGATQTATLTVGSNSNRILVAIFCYTGTSANKVTAISYSAGSGGTWTRLGGAQCSNIITSVEIWYSIAPSTGSVTVSPTFTGTADFLFTCASFYNADQTTGMNGFASSDGSVSVSITTTSGDYAVAGIIKTASPDPITAGTVMGSGGTDQIERTGRAAASGSSTTIAWTTNTIYTMTAGGNVIQAAASSLIANPLRGPVDLLGFIN